MKTIYLEHPHHLKKEDIKETALAIGYFDGVHKGHQKVILTAKEIATENNYQSGVMTFHPHPSVVLNKEKKQVHYITPLEEKLEQMKKLGVDVVYVVKFNEVLSKLDPEAFVDYFLINLNVKHVVAGFDYTYGNKGKGTMETMAEHGKGLLKTTTISKVTLDGDEKVSSTLIRKSLAEGNMPFVHELLGRPYELKGIVENGEKRGRTIGFPTANVGVSTEYIIPKIGIYAVKIKQADKTYDGMGYIGYNPTFHDDQKLVIEVNIFDFNGNIYGEELNLELYEFIRGDQKFAGIDELVSQMKNDEERIRAFFATSLT